MNIIYVGALVIKYIVLYITNLIRNIVVPAKT